MEKLPAVIEEEILEGELIEMKESASAVIPEDGALLIFITEEGIGIVAQ